MILPALDFFVFVDCGTCTKHRILKCLFGGTAAARICAISNIVLGVVISIVFTLQRLWPTGIIG